MFRNSCTQIGNVVLTSYHRDCLHLLKAATLVSLVLMCPQWSSCPVHVAMAPGHSPVHCWAGLLLPRQRAEGVCPFACLGEGNGEKTRAIWPNSCCKMGWIMNTSSRTKLHSIFILRWTRHIKRWCPRIARSCCYPQLVLGVQALDPWRTALHS